jgi:hypothetical protein
LDKGVETKVEVNAANGKIIEVSIEKWGIGEEADEKIKFSLFRYSNRWNGNSRPTKKEFFL